MQLSVEVRNAQANAAHEAIGEAPTLEVRSDVIPENCAAPDRGSLIALGTLPKMWFEPSADGVLRKAGLWEMMGQVEAGQGSTGSYFRIKQGGKCHMQGSFGFGKEMVPNYERIAFGQTVQIMEFNVKRGNA